MMAYGTKLDKTESAINGRKGRLKRLKKRHLPLIPDGTKNHDPLFSEQCLEQCLGDALYLYLYQILPNKTKALDITR